MEDEVSVGLSKIARGAAYLLVGTAAGKIFSFLNRIILARHYTPGEYGVYSMFLTIVSITTVLATLGLGEGVVRFIGYYRDRKDKISQIASSALFVVIATSSLVSAFLFILRDEIAEVLLHNPEASRAITFGIVAAFFMPITSVLANVARGFEKAKEYAVISSFGIPFGLFLVIIACVMMDVPIHFLILGVGMLYLFLSLTYFRIAKNLTKISIFKVNKKTAKTLLFFSTPLVISSILGMVMTWTDTLMLGYFYGDRVVGVYNVAVPVAKQLSLFLGLVAFIYGPFCSALYSKKKIKEIGRIYQVLTKWVFFAAFPFFAVLFVFPEATINLLFGKEYLAASKALQILAAAFMVNVMLGLNSYTLVVIGETRFILFSNLMGAFSNVLLNYVLIPRYGVVGAATASATSLLLVNLLASTKLYSVSKIQPLTTTYIKSIVAGLFSLFLINLIISGFFRVNIIVALVFLAAFLILYVTILVLLRAVDREDIELMRKIERRLGINLDRLVTILGRKDMS